MTRTIILKVNGATRQIETDPEKPLLWLLREDLGLTGTKLGCANGVCGACTVHVNGDAQRACMLSAHDVHHSEIVTIEGLAISSGSKESENHPAQRVWIELQVPQCGYCQSGMIMAAVALLKTNPTPTDAEIDTAITNLCRCGTYPRVRRAIHTLAQAQVSSSAETQPGAEPT